MKKLIFLLQDGLSVLLRESKVILLIVLSLGISIGVSFSMVSYCAEEMHILEEVEYDRATYQFYYQLTTEAQYREQPRLLSPMEAFDYLMFHSEFHVSQSYDSAYFSAFGQEGEAGDAGILWRPYAKQAHPLFKYQAEELIEGRWFDQEEADGRAAIVSRKDFPEVQVGQTVELFGEQLQVIGLLERDNYVPYTFMQEVTDREKGFYPLQFECTFSAPLTDERLLNIKERMTIDIRCRFDIRKGTYVQNILLMLAIVSGIFCMIMLNSLNLLKHMIHKSKYRFMVMKACGGSKALLFWGLYSVPTVLTVLAYIIGVVLHIVIVNPILMKYLNYPALQVGDYFLAFGVVLLFLFLVLLPTVKKTVYAQPSDTELWR